MAIMLKDRNSKLVVDAVKKMRGPKDTKVTLTLKRENNPELFDVAGSPSRAGLLSETVRQMPGAARSLHPVASVVAVGARAPAV